MATEKKVENSKKETGESPFLLLTDSQWRYITAMIENPTFSKKDAAEHIGLKPTTVYNWVQQAPYVEDALRLAREDLHAAALTARKQALLKAMRVKIALLDSDDEAIRSKASSEIIEWQLGKATQPQNNSGESTLRVVFEHGNDDYS